MSGSLDTHLLDCLLATSLSLQPFKIAILLLPHCVRLCACVCVCVCVFPSTGSHLSHFLSVVSSQFALPLSPSVTPIHKFFCSFKKQSIIFSKLSARNTSCIITFVIRKTHESDNHIHCQNNEGIRGPLSVAVLSCPGLEGRVCVCPSISRLPCLPLLPPPLHPFPSLEISGISLWLFMLCA